MPDAHVAFRRIDPYEIGQHGLIRHGGLDPHEALDGQLFGIEVLTDIQHLHHTRCDPDLEQRQESISPLL